MKEHVRVAVIAGASRGLGSSVCRALRDRGFRVVAMGRRAGVAAVADMVEGVVPVDCELTEVSAVDRAFADIEREMGTPSAVVYNAHRLELRTSAATPFDMFESVWRVNCFGAYVVARRAIPGMLERGAGALIFSGATASRRGGKRTAAFASSKFALRGLAQSLARELGPHGIHVAHVVLDGLIWSEQTRARFSAEEAQCMSPDDVAAVYASLVEQPRSAWTHEIDLRPWLEKF
jgi:NAD(P)-dependent dehydrogenase (short-subunit alcohol dehydrogenase family)